MTAEPAFTRPDLDLEWHKREQLRDPQKLNRAIQAIAFRLSRSRTDEAGPWKKNADALARTTAIHFYARNEHRATKLLLGAEAGDLLAIRGLVFALKWDGIAAEHFEAELGDVPEITVKEIVRALVPRPFCHGDEIWHYVNQPNIHRCSVCMNQRPSTKHDRGEAFSPEYRRTPSRSKRERVMQRYQYRCVNCSIKDELQMGHCISVAEGRDNAIDPELLNSDENYVPMCRSCNAEQGAQSLTPEEYLGLAVPQTVVAIYRTLKELHGTA